MEIDSKIIYEVALRKVLEKEQQLIELTALYQQTLQEIEQLKKQLNQDE